MGALIVANYPGIAGTIPPSTQVLHLLTFYSLPAESLKSYTACKPKQQINLYGEDVAS